MGIVQSLGIPENSKFQNFDNVCYTEQILEELLQECAMLISDVEEKKVDETILMQEIEKRITRIKGVINPELLKRHVFDYLYGYGILQPLIEDETISDIDIPRYDFITYKIRGVTQKSSLEFENEQAFNRFSKMLIIRHGGIINDVDNHCRISDVKNRLRVNVCIPPRNVYGTSMNIRKHAMNTISLRHLMALGMLDETTFDILSESIKSNRSILICGKGAAGKTTLLRAVIENGDELERMLICETDTELYPQKKSVIVQYLKKNEFGGKKVTLSDLIREGLTMHLDAYCIGEIIGGEAWDFVKAGYTDHRILGTIHASGCEDAIQRLAMLCEQHTHFPYEQLMEVIKRSVGVVVYLKKFEIHEVYDFNLDRCVYKKSEDKNDCSHNYQFDRNSNGMAIY
jgi:pilus assembly protein CpaF